MLFSSLEFILMFLPVTVLIYYMLLFFKLNVISRVWLVVASLFFYSWWNISYLPLLLLSMFINYFTGSAISKADSIGKKKTLLSAGIVFNVGLLGYFKYTDFFIENMNAVFDTNTALLNLLLPLAISFFTFEQIAYIVDAYRGSTKEKDFLNYALFVTFFPRLIAGPIILHQELIPQFHDAKNKRINAQNVAAGIFIFMIGLCKKVAIADTLAVYANDGFANYANLTVLEAWVTSLSYTYQLYFDFSGYCDMAIGIGLLFNIKLPVNFFSPYKARNIQEFWKRWHMTLGRFLTSYLYIPLGGSKEGSYKLYRNILIVFAVSGIWHGAGWTFVIWGLMHGLASVLCRAWPFKLPAVISWFLTFQFVNVAWVYFRADTVHQANTIIKTMFSAGQFQLEQLTAPVLSFSTALSFSFSYERFAFHFAETNLILSGLLAATILVFFFKNSIQIKDSFQPSLKYSVWVSSMLFLVLSAVFLLNKNSEFLYFNF
ncbi:MBOAT family O-acyltransferase [Fictibacillus aquaticus]|uniref:Membrane-bound O-acyltransferase family protein n=1 Tax=Fictibacillus aquaticus TaxID=2021314 RepID=A0A235F9H9_9BACL|nr:MBOAT family O-acyltransferase [Fictibacillus aquaticus]OYD57734.1 membrane-bound O-acyltransferase family protein [Fictibacillus aquaticus]